MPVCFLPTGVAAIGRIGALRGKGAAAGLADCILSLFQPQLPFVSPNTPLCTFVITVFLDRHSGIEDIAATPADDPPDRGNEVLRTAV